MRRTVDRQYSTPPQLARELGVAEKKIIEWIESGELAAINLARRGSTRPRYSIPPEALDAFRAARTVVPVTPSVPRIRRRSQPDVREYV